MFNTLADSSLPSKPLFSAVVAVYNVAQYLPSFLASLRQQKIDGGDLEIIFVDDASTDGSLDHVLAWALERDNVVVLRSSENRGPAHARAAGYDLARGQWVTSVDPDDILHPNYFSAVAEFTASQKADMLTTRVVNYNERLGLAQFTHPLDFKYRNGTQVLHLLKEPRVFQLGATAFVRTERLRTHGITFNPEVRPSFEDANMLARYLFTFDDPTVAVIDNALYFYRDRVTQGSLVSSAWDNPLKYTAEIEAGYLPLINLAKDKFGQVPRWLANMLIYQLSWQLIESLSPRGRNAWVLRNEALRQQFLELCEAVLLGLEPQALEEFSVREIEPRLRGALLTRFYYDECVYHDLRGPSRIYTRRYPQPCYADQGIVRAVYVFGEIFGYETTLRGQGAEAVVPENVPTFADPIDDDFGIHTPPLPHDNVVGRLSGSSGIAGIADVVRLNMRLLTLPRNKDIPAPFKPIARKIVNKFPVLVRRVGLKAALKAGTLTSKVSSLSNPYRNAWLITDRMAGANDNGEHFYRYMMRHHPEENIFFMLSKDAPDHARLVAEGFKILPHNVVEVARALENAQVIIASDWAADDLAYVWNLRADGNQTPLVFLQHGITKDDISHWLNGLHLSMIVTTLTPEHEYLTSPDSPYDFKEGQAVRSGMPRYDRLRELAGRQINAKPRLLIMPTWRNSLRDRLRDLSGGKRSEAFRESQYFQAWNALFTHPRFAQLVADDELEVHFVSHPNIVEFLDDYTLPEQVKRHDLRTIDFQQELSQSNIFLTDYSSAAFDAAIAGSRIAYYQFDAESFFGGEQSMNPGWFDYHRDGLGPVIDDVEAVIRWVERMMSPESSDDEYEERRERMRQDVPEHACLNTYSEIKRRYGNSR